MPFFCAITGCETVPEFPHLLCKIHRQNQTLEVSRSQRDLGKVD